LGRRCHSEEVTDEEIGAAPASRRCQVRFDYPEKVTGLPSAHEREAEAAHRDDLKAAWKVFEGRIMNAGCVLASKSPAPAEPDRATPSVRATIGHLDEQRSPRPVRDQPVRTAAD
jgi:hypothetical protein